MTSYFFWRSFRWNPLSRLYLSANSPTDIDLHGDYGAESVFAKRPGCSATLMCTRAKPSRSHGSYGYDMLKEFESRKYSSTLRLSAAWLKANLFKRGLFQRCRRFFLRLNTSYMACSWCKLTRLPKRLALFATFFLQKAWQSQC